MIAKLINGNLIQPSSTERKKIVIANPSDDILKYVMKYKDVAMDEKPEYNPETQYLVESYEETDSTITVHWKVLDIEDPVIEDNPETIDDPETL